MKNENEKNVVDKFLDKYEEVGVTRPDKVRVYKKPSKFICIRNFIISVLILFVMLFVFGFHKSLSYVLFLLADLCIALFYGINLFTKDGIALTTYVNKPKDKDE